MILQNAVNYTLNEFFNSKYGTQQIVDAPSPADIEIIIKGFLKWAKAENRIENDKLDLKDLITE